MGANPIDAGGHQFTPASNLQLGLLWHARSSEDFFRLQFYYTHNFDLRKRSRVMLHF